MFYLWSGIITGVLIGFASDGMKDRHRRVPTALIGVTALFILFTPIAADIWKIAGGRLGWIEAMRGVILPLAVGIGLGAWGYLVARESRPGQAGKAQVAGGGAPSGRPAGPTGGSTSASPTPEPETPVKPRLAPLVFASVVAFVMVSESQYGWLQRLQKFSFGGGSVELSASRTAQATHRDSPTAGIVSTINTGQTPVNALLGYMAGWVRIIEEDQEQAETLFSDRALPPRPELIQTERDFANLHIRPLGAKLMMIFGKNSYGGIDFVLERAFVDEFSEFAARLYGGRLIDAGRGSPRSVAESLARIWAKACLMERSGLDPRKLDQELAETVQYRFGEGCDRDESGRARDIESGLRAGAFRPDLPYAAILSARLLDAAGETNGALWQIESWTSGQPGFGGAGDLAPRHLLPLHRAFAHAVSIAIRGTGLPAIPLLRQATRFGGRLLRESPLRDQIDIAPKPWPIASILASQDCSALTRQPVKKSYLRHLSILNSKLSYLSQYMDYTRENGLIDEMTKTADYLVAAPWACLNRGEPTERVLADESARADTVASVHYALALENAPFAVKRDHLCVARRHAAQARSAAQKLAGYLSDGPTRWDEKVSRLVAFADLATYARRLELIEAEIATAAYDCPP